MKATAVLVLTIDGSAKPCLRWLGDKPVWRWCLDQLLQVSGIDSIVCLVPEKAPVDASSISDCPNVSWQTCPEKVFEEEIKFYRFLSSWDQSPCQDAGIVLAVSAVYPFLSGARLELCVNGVRDGLVEAAVPAQAFLACGEPCTDGSGPVCRARRGQFDDTQYWARLPGVCAFRLPWPNHGDPFHCLPVKIESSERLSSVSQSEFCLAQAMMGL